MEHDLNILVILGIKEKLINLTHKCCLWLVLCSRDTYSLTFWGVRTCSCQWSTYVNNPRDRRCWVLCCVQSCVPVGELKTRALELFMCSVTERRGYGEALRWLSHHISYTTSDDVWCYTATQNIILLYLNEFLHKKY